MNRLSAEQFELVTGSLRSDRSFRASEKRRRPRVGLRNSLLVFRYPSPSPGSKPIAVSVRDLSADGIGLTSPIDLPQDSEFIAEFDRAGERRLRLRYRVAHCKAIARGLFAIGAKLIQAE